MNFKDKLKSFLWNAGAVSIQADKNNSGKSIILIYHGIVPDDHLRFNYRFITISNFKQQLKLIKKKFNLVSVDDIYNRDTDSHNLNIAITFDDGYKNNYTYAAEILSEHNIPASFYITTIGLGGYKYLWADYLDIITKYAGGNLIIDGITFSKNKKEFIHAGKSLKNHCRTAPWSFKEKMFNSLDAYKKYVEIEQNKNYWQLMDEREIRSLSENSLFTIGSHGVYHNNLASINTEDAKAELINSKDFLDRLTGKKIDQIAYPDGSYNEHVIEMALQAGYTKQLLVSFNNNEKNHNEATKERFGINPFLHAVNQVKYLGRGKY